MRASLVAFPAYVFLSACGDPFAGVERVSDGVLPPQINVATALPTQEELERETSVLSGLFRKPQNETVRAAPANVSADGTSVSQATALGSENAEGGLEDPVSSAAATDEKPADAAPTAQEQIIVAEAVTPKPKPKGVVGWLRRAAESQDRRANATEDVALRSDVDAEADDSETLIEETKIANLSSEAIPASAPTTLGAPRDVPASNGLVEPQKRQGLFGRSTSAPTAGLALRDVALGTILPFGEVGRVCNVRPSELGKRIDQAARKGADYALYDSVPNGTARRTFYVTGFSDNCARQFTASLALFGSPEFHEQLRYGLPAKEYPYSSTDTAYEKVKQSVCNVARNKPCGSRIDRLNNTTAFVSVYEHFEENARWADMLLHDGALLAAAVKTP